MRVITARDLEEGNLVEELWECSQGGKERYWDSESWVILKGEQRSVSIKSRERERGESRGDRKRERRGQKRGKRETQVVRCEDKT